MRLISTLNSFQPPHAAGCFGSIRKYDIHTGIDLYCFPHTLVPCLKDGEVVDVGLFTGELAGSPWWNNTSYVVVKDDKNYILYGELFAFVEIGEQVIAGQQIGSVLPVLKKDKGLPTCMLHLEYYSSYLEPVWWKLDADRPHGLLDPTNLVCTN